MTLLISRDGAPLRCGHELPELLLIMGIRVTYGHSLWPVFLIVLLPWGAGVVLVTADLGLPVNRKHTLDVFYC